MQACACSLLYLVTEWKKCIVVHMVRVNICLKLQEITVSGALMWVKHTYDARCIEAFRSG
jgi:hypothetical protein